MSAYEEWSAAVTYSDSHLFDIDPSLVVRYLRHQGWISEELKGNLWRVYFTDAESAPVEIFLERHSSNKSANKQIYFALNTISDMDDISVEEVSRKIKALTYDQISSKIPDEYIVNDTIQLKIASQYINQMKGFLASAASAEITGETYVKRTRKEALVYAEQCRFGHTFRGSFGFLIESPTGLNDAPSMNIVSENVPPSRRFIERIGAGLTDFHQAVITQDITFITKSQGGFNANMCDALADVLDETDVSGITIGILPSPEWRSPKLAEMVPVSVQRKNIDILREAAKSLSVNEKPRSVRVFGRIRRVETDGNPSDLLEDTALREVEVNWVGDDNVLLHVKIILSNSDYVTAVDAHKTGKPISATGLLVRAGRSWRLENVSDFRVIDV